MFETRSHAWKEVGLLRQISPRVVKRARVEALLLVPLFVGVVVLFEHRVSLLGPAEAHERHPSLGSLEAPVQIATVLLLEGGLLDLGPAALRLRDRWRGAKAAK